MDYSIVVLGEWVLGNGDVGISVIGELARGVRLMKKQCREEGVERKL